MSYAIMRLSKLKTSSDIQAMQKEHLDRDSALNKYNKNIDKSKSVLNIPIIGLGNERTLLSKTDKYIKSKFIPSRGSPAVRKDAVKIIDFFFGSDNKKMLELNNTGQLNNYFNDCIEWLGKNFGGKDNIMLFVPHYDETTIHAHACICPMTEEGRLSAHSFTKNRYVFRNLQDTFYNEVGSKYGMERGECIDLTAEKTRKHIPPAVMREKKEAKKVLEEANQKLEYAKIKGKMISQMEKDTQQTLKNATMKEKEVKENEVKFMKWKKHKHKELMNKENELNEKSQELNELINVNKQCFEEVNHLLINVKNIHMREQYEEELKQLEQKNEKVYRNFDFIKPLNVGTTVKKYDFEPDV